MIHRGVVEQLDSNVLGATSRLRYEEIAKKGLKKEITSTELNEKLNALLHPRVLNPKVGSGKDTMKFKKKK